MMRRWRESEWGRARRQRKEAKSPARRWVGTSFDVGLFLGVNVIEEAPRRGDSADEVLTRPSASHHGSSAGAETFVTAPSHASHTPTAHADRPSFLWKHSHDENSHLRSNYAVDEEEPRPVSASSSTAALLRPTTRDNLPSEALTDIPTRPRLSDSLSPLPHSDGRLKKTNVHVSFSDGKGGKIRNSDAIVEESPVAPEEVLSRTGNAVQDSSAGAVEQASIEDQVDWGDVIMRDRMLVKVSSSEVGIMPVDFDESRNRTTGHLQNENWAELIVVWRKDRLELYKDHSTPGKDWLTGHKELAFVVPLGSSTTRLSLYSFVDLTFCLICPPAKLRNHSRGRWFFSSTEKDTQIFVFKPRCRSRAVDWFWKLWRNLGGQLPPSLDVRCPALDTRIKIDIPNHESDVMTAYSVFSPQNVVRLCERNLREMPDYDVLIKQRLQAGGSLELAWRFDTNLDWVWRLEDVQGQPRDWSVLSGLALKQGGRSAHLELRLRAHQRTRIHLKDGTRLDEPPAVEGFLERIRPNSQTRQPVYLVVHDGYLFSLPPAHAHTPPPPGLAPTEDARRIEVRRGTRQILRASGVSDLRGIVAVRRAFQLIPRHAAERPGGDTPDWEDRDGFWEAVERTEGDDQDPGGELGMVQVQDKVRLRMRRSFELLLNTGHVVRFEAYSCQVALEWIMRLRPLVSYWKKRHQFDAHNEMDLAHFSTGRTRITPQTHVVESDDTAPEPLPDPDASLPELSFFFNWCVLDDCRPILKCGKIFGRKGLWGPYQQLQLVLVSGVLVQYRITEKTSFHHRRHKPINLLDAYVCSGYIAAQYLPEGQYNADAPSVARRYPDGLETEDSEENTLFMIWFRSQSQFGGIDASGDSQGISAPHGVPPLSAKRKLAVFRTRSKLERDAWVWAINSEIEKVVRAAREWEDKVREAGELRKT
ncbi:Pleckstrin homology domain-containing protein [Amylocystis lapponica]|nr:Pleckstrin homology domain-containing protein [Amylocystis lapponica]